MISVVVPTYNRVEVLPRALESLARQCTFGCFEFEIVVVDNGSNDATADFLQSVHAPIRAFRETRAGESWARNLGIEQARGQWIAFFDDDQVARPDWLYQLWRSAQSGRCAIVAGDVHLEADAHFLEHLGPQLRALLGELKWPDRCHLRPPSSAACSNALVKATVFQEIGGFDVSLTVAADTEFFLRAGRAGFCTQTCPQAVVLQNVPPGRLEWDFLRSRALWQGTYLAKLMGRNCWLPTVSVVLPRLLKAALWHAPASLLGQGDWKRLGHRAMLWKAFGALRGLLALSNSQVDYFEGLKAEARRRNQVGP